MFKNLKERYEKRSEKGFTLVELIVSMAIFAIITPFIVTLMTSSINMRDSAENGRDTSQAASFMSSVFTNDVKKSSYVKVSDSKTELSVRKGDECILWSVRLYTDEEGSPQTALYRKTAINDRIFEIDETYITPTKTTDNRVVKNIDLKPNHEYFKQSPSGQISYDIPLTDKSNNFILKGSAQSEVASGGKGVC